MSLASKPGRLKDESGSMLVELLIALSFLAVAVGALISVFASSILSLRHASIEGNALTLVDRQIEVLKTLPYAGIRLSAGTIPSGSDPYVTSPATSLTPTQQASISGGQVTGGTIAATQTVTGPDNRTYRVDSYIFTNAPTSPVGEDIRQATVTVRLVTGGTVGPIRAQASSAFDAASTIAAT